MPTKMELVLEQTQQVLRYDGDECDKGRMPTKIELTLEQIQQGVSNDVLVSIEEVEELKRNVWIKDGNPSRATIKQALGRSYTLSWKPCQGDSLSPPDHRSYALSWKPCQGDYLNLPDHRIRDGVAASFQRSRIHHHMSMLKRQRHTKHQEARQVDGLIKCKLTGHVYRMKAQVILAFLKELIVKVYGLHVPLLELSRFEIPLGELEASQLVVMLVVKKGIMQIISERPPTTMPREEPTY
nr:hypothetical protein [Tanacetum cinerariifolium]